jgi:hypothetical protein
MRIGKKKEEENKNRRGILIVALLPSHLFQRYLWRVGADNNACFFA